MLTSMEANKNKSNYRHIKLLLLRKPRLLKPKDPETLVLNPPTAERPHVLINNMEEMSSSTESDCLCEAHGSTQLLVPGASPENQDAWH